MYSTAIYFEKLSLATFVKSVLGNPSFRKFLKKDKLDVFYIDSTIAANKVIVPLLQMLNIRVRRLEFKLIDIKDDRAELVRLRIPSKDLFDFQSEILNSHEYRKTYHESWSQGRLLKYISKGLIDVSIMDEKSVSRTLFCIQVVHWHLQKNEYILPIFIINKRAWFNIYVKYASHYKIRLFGVIDNDFLLSKSIILAWIRKKPQIYGLIKKIGSKQFLKKNKSVVNSKYKIYADGRGDVNLVNDGNHSDFFWYLNSDLSADNILYKSLSCDEDLLLEKEGIQFLHDDIEISPKYIRRYDKPQVCFNNKFKYESKAIKTLLEQYDLERYIWSQFFKKNNVKIYFTWFKYANDHMAIADAISDNGGISILWQMAFDGFGSAGTIHDCDISFCFSHFNHELDNKSGSSVGYTVITGYPKDYAPPLLLNKAEAVRKELQDNGAKKIVFVIDENSLDDNRWHTGHELQRENYSYILEKVLATPWLGVIFKPKVARTLRRRLGDVAILLDKALKTGRCYLYEDSNRRTTSVSPILAGLSSDLCIHSDLSGGTAALECALEGIPTLLIDREGCPDSKFYELPEGKVIFKNWPETINAVMEHFTSEDGISGFGDWSSIIDDLDPFRDGNAANRIGTYLSWLMEGYEKGLEKDLILKDAADKYRDKWGHDKVIVNLD